MGMVVVQDSHLLEVVSTLDSVVMLEMIEIVNRVQKAGVKCENLLVETDMVKQVSDNVQQSIVSTSSDKYGTHRCEIS